MTDLKLSSGRTIGLQTFPRVSDGWFTVGPVYGFDDEPIGFAILGRRRGLAVYVIKSRRGR